MFSKWGECLVTKYNMNLLWRSKLARQKFNFSVSFSSKNQKDFTYFWSIICYGNVWASGSAVGFSKCSPLDSTVFFSSWSLNVFSPYSTQMATFSSPKVYTCSLQTLKNCTNVCWIILIISLPSHELAVFSPHHSASISFPALKFFFLSYPCGISHWLQRSWWKFHAYMKQVIFK